jgi:opacity protein-like surface antigen
MRIAKQQRPAVNNRVWATGIGALALTFGSAAFAQGYAPERGYDRSYERGYSGWQPQRAGSWEVAIGGRYASYDTIRFNSDITMTPEDSFGAGVSIGYNFDPFLNLSFEIFGDDANYRSDVDFGDGTFGAIDGSLDTSSGQLNLTWHWFDSAVTPFVSAGVGWTWLDSNIISGYDGVECWYHPWYGYSCSDVYDTYDDTSLSYNLAIGLRFDLSDQFFLRASAGRQWIYMDQTSSNPSVDFARVELGMMF